MKKLIAILMTIAIAGVVVAGCNKDEAAATDNGTATTTDNGTTTPADNGTSGG